MSFVELANPVVTRSNHPIEDSSWHAHIGQNLLAILSNDTLPTTSIVSQCLGAQKQNVRDASSSTVAMEERHGMAW